MTGRRTKLLTATATAALLGASASGAFAFDEVNWRWDKQVTETVDINVDIDTVITPSGLVEVEKLQVHFGDVKAKAIVNGIYNNAGGEGGENGSLTIDETVRINTTYDDDPDPGGIDPAGPAAAGPLNVGVTGGFVDEGSDEMGVDIRVQGEIPLNGIGFLRDAADLPKIENAATAVANNQSIESDVPLYLHDAQFAAGDIGLFDRCIDCEGPSLPGIPLLALDGENGDGGGNMHHEIAGLLTLGALFGVIEPAEVKAKAEVSDILNAYVENAATAVVNNASFEIESADPDNHVIVADLTQWSLADVRAKASVYDVTLNGYTGFGAAGLGGGGDITPIVSNAATAVGNNLNIRVGAPSVE